MASYWLFKTEPSEYSITDLAGEPGATVRWDGIRNYQARNHLRDDVARGDQVLIYHSSCKVPGIAGTARISSMPYPDPTQFDPGSPYHDSRASPEHPRWFCVDIRHHVSFDEVVPATHLKAAMGLADMVLFRQGRLSIQPVREQEWQIIMEMGKSSGT